MNLTPSAIMLSLALLLVPSADALRSGRDPLELAATSWTEENVRVLGTVKARVCHPEIPILALPRAAAHEVETDHATLSPGLTDPVLEEARRRKVVDDFKPLSDAIPKPLTAAQRWAARLGLATQRWTLGDRAAVKAYIAAMYDFRDELTALAPERREEMMVKWRLLSPHREWNEAFAYTERYWVEVLRESPAASKGSLLPSRFPVLIAAPGRFHEAYYWDTYFGVRGLLATGRVGAAQMQAQNFLEAVRRYCLMPNGMRDYYLSRSQPPFLSSLTREVYEASLKGADDAERERVTTWLRDFAFPLLERDYAENWMDPGKHFDERTGLNHHWDLLDTPRPERHASDDDAKLGKTYRDTRAEAESGEDFTDAFAEQASRVAGVLLNSLLYKTERDLAAMARELGQDAKSRDYESKAERRKAAMDRYLWNPGKKHYENYLLGDATRPGHRIPYLAADTFAPLFVGAASAAQAAGVAEALPMLEGKAGIKATALANPKKQWTAPNGWPPHQIMAMYGLKAYGFDRDARRLAAKWVQSIADVHRRTGVFFERMDVEKGTYPGLDDDKYAPQKGFTWTNGSFIDALTGILGVRLGEEPGA